MERHDPDQGNDQYKESHRGNGFSGSTLLDTMAAPTVEIEASRVERKIVVLETI